MTCIAAVIAPDGSIAMGGDHAGTASYTTTIRRDPKVFTNGPFLFGFTHSFRMGDLLRYKFIPPSIEEGEDLDTYMRTKFIDEVRTVFATGGFLYKQNDREAGGNFLAAIEGRVFEVEADYQVGESTKPYAAVGSGMDLALGSLHTTHRLGMGKEDRVELALRAAAEHNAAVREPFTILSTKPRRKPGVFSDVTGF